MANDPTNPMLTYWMKMWQQQFEQGLRYWAAFGGMVPRPSAADLSAEAEAAAHPGEPHPQHKTSA